MQERERQEKLYISHYHLDFLFSFSHICFFIMSMLNVKSLFHKIKYLDKYLTFSCVKMFPLKKKTTGKNKCHWEKTREKGQEIDFALETFSTIWVIHCTRIKDIKKL